MPTPYNRFSAYQQVIDPASTVTFSGAVNGQAVITPGQPSTAAVALSQVPGQPAGTFGSSSGAVVETVNQAGQVVETDQVGIKSTGLIHARTIAMTGDVAWSVSFDGTGNVTAAGTLANVNSNVGSFGDAQHVAQVTLNAKGLATAAAAVEIIQRVTVVGSLGAATAGRTAHVTDSTVSLAAGLGNVVAGTGANYTPVYADGSAWRIG